MVSNARIGVCTANDLSPAALDNAPGAPALRRGYFPPVINALSSSMVSVGS